MSGKKTPPTTGTTTLPALKIGSRVRCTDDNVAGRIVWANGLSVKIKWDDGEQVTWRRDALAGRPVEILDADAEGGRTEAPAALAASAQTAPTELHPAEPETAPTTAEPAVTEIASRNPQP